MLSDVSWSRSQSVLLLTAAVLLLSVLAAAAEGPRGYEYVLTIGSAGGVNPPQRLTGRGSRLAFGKPERLSPLVTPDSVIVDPDQRVWITDRSAPGVHVFDLLQGEYKFLRGGDDKCLFQCPAGIAADIHGRVYVSDPCSRSVLVFDRDTSFLRLLVDGRKNPVIRRPGSLLVSHDLKSVFIADPPRHKVVVFNQEGETVREFGGADELDLPAALATWDDLIYVLDQGRGQVQVYSPGGALQRSLKWDRVRNPSAFAVDTEQGLYFVGDPKFGMVQVFDEAGVDVSAFGQAGSGLDEIRIPSYIYVDAQQRIYIVDPQNAKVLIFRQATGGALPSALKSSAVGTSSGTWGIQNEREQQNTLHSRKRSTDSARKDAPGEGVDQP